MPRKSGTTYLVRLVLLLSLGMAAMPASSQTPAPVPAIKPFVMGADAAPDSLAFHWARLIYVEAFKRLGIPLEVVTYTLTRRSALVESGAIDGEVSRVYGYADAHPDLIRIEEPVMDFTFSLFTADPKLEAKNIEELPPKALVEYRRGVLICEKALRKSIPPGRLSDVPLSEQGIKKLLAGRTDAFCDINSYVAEALHSDELKGASGVSGVRKLFDIASLPTYPYVFRKHAALAPKLTAVLKQMRAEGLLAAYPKQAEREMGWTK